MDERLSMKNLLTQWTTKEENRRLITKAFIKKIKVFSQI